jgi:RNA polymerase sigma factor (sigma-70 family)
MVTDQVINVAAEASRVEPPAADGRLPAIWSQVAPQLAQLARALGMDDHGAEDVLQDVYLTACEKSPERASGEELRRWLFTVTANRCRLEHRRQSRWRRVLSRLGQWCLASQPAAAAGELAKEAEERERVRQTLERLPETQRLVLVLRYFSGFDSKQIGKILEMPDSTVRSHLLAARKALAQRLKQAGYSHE